MQWQQKCTTDDGNPLLRDNGNCTKDLTTFVRVIVTCPNTGSNHHNTTETTDKMGTPGGDGRDIDGPSSNYGYDASYSHYEHEPRQHKLKLKVRSRQTWPKMAGILNLSRIIMCFDSRIRPCNSGIALRACANDKKQQHCAHTNFH